MSLDVYLKLVGAQIDHKPAIYIREDGTNKQITRAEWDERFPDRTPFIFDARTIENTVFDYNITHNLRKMAGEAGIYQHLWRPEELEIEMAIELVEPLEKGLELLESDPERFREFNPINGWGDYEGLVKFVREYLNACKRYPNSTVHIWR